MIVNCLEQHPLIFENGILGFAGYLAEGMFSVHANGDNNFLLYGIAENSLLVVDQKQPFETNKLNVFLTDVLVDGQKQMKLSLSMLEKFPYVGRVVMSVSQYE